MLTYLKSKELDDVFPNLIIVLGMFLCNKLSRKLYRRKIIFSVLKRVKNYT